MATSDEFGAYVGRQLAGSGAAIRKLFGEYAVYLNGKAVALVCDNRFLVKIVPCAAEMCPGTSAELPYMGGKPMLRVENLDDTEFLCALVTRLSVELPAPRPKKKKGTK